MEECPVCFELLETDVGVLACRHSFHCNCLLEWKKTLGARPLECPICRNSEGLVAIIDFYLSKNGSLRYKFSTKRARQQRKTHVCTII